MTHFTKKYFIDRASVIAVKLVEIIVVLTCLGLLGVILAVIYAGLEFRMEMR